MGGEVSFPHGEVKYDLLADFNGKLSRVQVKSTLVAAHTSVYVIQASYSSSKKRTQYSKEHCDFMVCVLPWADFVVPVEELKGKKLIFFQPGTHRCRRRYPICKYEQFREAWHLLQP